MRIHPDKIAAALDAGFDHADIANELGDHYGIMDKIKKARDLGFSDEDIVNEFSRSPTSEGLKEAFVGGAKEYGSDVATAARQLIGSKNEAVKQGLSEDIARTERPSFDYQGLKDIYSQEGIIPAATEFVKEIPGTIAHNLPSATPIMAGAGAGARLGAALAGVPGALIGGIAGGTLAGYPQQHGSEMKNEALIQQQAGKNIDIENADTWKAALPNSVLDAVGNELSFGLSKLFGARKLGTEAAENLAKEGIAKTLATGTAKGFLGELPTEVAQSMISRYHNDQSLTDQDAMDEYFGVILNAAALSPMGAASRVVEKSQAAKDTEELQKQEAERQSQEAALAARADVSSENIERYVNDLHPENRKTPEDIKQALFDEEDWFHNKQDLDELLKENPDLIESIHQNLDENRIPREVVEGYVNQFQNDTGLSKKQKKMRDAWGESPAGIEQFQMPDGTVIENPTNKNIHIDAPLMQQAIAESGRMSEANAYADQVTARRNQAEQENQLELERQQQFNAANEKLKADFDANKQTVTPENIKTVLDQQNVFESPSAIKNALYAYPYFDKKELTQYLSPKGGQTAGDIFRQRANERKDLSAKQKLESNLSYLQPETKVTGISKKDIVPAQTWDAWLNEPELNDQGEPVHVRREVSPIDNKVRSYPLTRREYLAENEDHIAAFKEDYEREQAKAQQLESDLNESSPYAEPDQKEKTFTEKAKEHAPALQRMAELETGWQNDSGKLVKDTSGKITRMPWVPVAPWYKNMPEDARFTGADGVKKSMTAVQKAIEGKRLGAKELRHVTGMLDAIESDIAENKRRMQDQLIQDERGNPLFNETGQPLLYGDTEKAPPLRKNLDQEILRDDTDHPIALADKHNQITPKGLAFDKISAKSPDELQKELLKLFNGSNSKVAEFIADHGGIDSLYVELQAAIKDQALSDMGEALRHILTFDKSFIEPDKKLSFQDLVSAISRYLEARMRYKIRNADFKSNRKAVLNELRHYQYEIPEEAIKEANNIARSNVLQGDQAAIFDSPKDFRTARDKLHDAFKGTSKSPNDAALKIRRELSDYYAYGRSGVASSTGSFYLSDQLNKDKTLHEANANLLYDQALNHKIMASKVAQDGKLVFDSQGIGRVLKVENGSLGDVTSLVLKLGEKIGSTKEAKDIVQRWLVANRFAGEKKRNARINAEINAIDPSDKKAIKKLKKELFAISPEQEAAIKPALELANKHPELKDISKIVKTFIHNQLDTLVKSGVLSEKAAAEYKSREGYVPLYRVMDESEEIPYLTKEHKAKGSERFVHDVLENLRVRNEYAVRTALKNHADMEYARTLADKDDKGDVRYYHKVPSGESAFFSQLNVKGKRRFVRYANPELAQAIKGLRSEERTC